MLPADVTLELAECECRCEPPKTSLFGRSVGSIATLFLRFWSCGTWSRPIRSAITDGSAGLCARIGTVELRAPVPDDELREAVRFTVTIEADEKEFEREEEYLWCLGMAEGGLVFDDPETGAGVAAPRVACILCSYERIVSRRTCARAR